MLNRDQAYSLVLTACLAASAVLNVTQNRELRRITDPGPMLRPGDPVPDLRVSNVAGNEQVIGFTGTVPTVLYVFRPSCIWCARNEGSIHALSRGASKRFRFIGVSLTSDGLAEFLTAHQFEFPVVTNLAPNVRAQYKLTGTPETIVVSPAGRVLKVWSGAYTEELQGQI